MELLRDAKVFAGIILPTVQYGGLAILGMLTHGVAGTGGAEAGLNAGWRCFGPVTRTRGCG
jgi:hypothetical protein